MKNRTSFGFACVVCGFFLGGLILPRVFAQADFQTPQPLHDMAESIVLHLERLDSADNIDGQRILPKLTVKDRARAVEQIEGILVDTLNHQGYVRLEFANGKPVEWRLP